MDNKERIKKLKATLKQLNKLKKSADDYFKKAEIKIKKGRALLLKDKKDKSVQDNLEKLNDMLFDIKKQIKTSDYMYRKYIEKINKELIKLSKN